MQLDDLTWFLVIGSLVGGQLVINRNKIGYFIWIVVNLLWVIFFLYKGLHSSVFLFLVYMCQSLIGYVKWNKVESVEAKLKPQ